ncbi:MAG: hypothetical protein QOJ26_734 [Thermoplasmata archaeon]|jgi:hypothetical protein|nr:hypothetical protein [Thermoplasmata archaeon]
MKRRAQESESALQGPFDSPNAVEPPSAGVGVGVGAIGDLAPMFLQSGGAAAPPGALRAPISTTCRP